MNAEDYKVPHEVTDVQVAFPAQLGHLLPPMETIPDDYPNRRDWQRFQAQWFMGMLPEGFSLHASPGIDARTAARHLAVIQGSFEPKHEHKADAVAWLASIWLDKVTDADGAVLFPTK